MIKQITGSLFTITLGLFSLHQLALAADTDSITYTAPSSISRGKNIVLLAGDEEYRSEEALPMLGQILSQRHGFDCTVLFSLDEDGIINPNQADSLSNPAALESADAIVMLLRFRHWNNATMTKFNAAIQRGVPIIALRTSTHAFEGFAKQSPWHSWNASEQGGWGKRVLGETWVSHWGRHKVEATLGEIEPAARGAVLLKGVTRVFGNTDVYEAYPPKDAKILLRGYVLKGMNPDDLPAQYARRRTPDNEEQPVNNPAMPVAWTREVQNESGCTNRILCTTLGAATDLLNADLRRLIINGVFWGLRLEVPAKANVDFVAPYHPSMYGFNAYRRGLKPSDYSIDLQPPLFQPSPESRPRRMNGN